LWIGLHLPRLSLEAFAATLAGPDALRPRALLHEHQVAQADAAARERGVRPGQKRATALALAPELLLGQADEHRDAAALHAVAHAALAFTPAVSLQPPCGVLLEVQSCLRYFGGLATLQQRLQDALAPLGHRLRLASAPSATGALLLARWRRDLALGPQATDAEALRRLLDDAPLALLRAGREHGEALLGMGLHTLADLRRLPRAGLARRFGSGLLDELDRARCDAPDPREPILPPPCFANRLELMARADNTEQLMAGARVLLARLVAWAQARHGRITRFTLRAHAESSSRVRDEAPAGADTLELALAEPSADGAHLQLLLAERLARWPLPAPALELSLACNDLVPGAPPSGELFPSPAGEREGLTRLVERLQARLGREQVLRIVTVDDHRPERATRLEPAQPLRPLASGAPAGLPPPLEDDDTLTRPPWLLHTPRPLPERNGLPLHAGRPLALLAGPERIESGWWDGGLVTRDYFIAQAFDGGLLWLYRNRLPPSAGEDSGWFLQGWFG
jgi:protein ImuB